MSTDETPALKSDTTGSMSWALPTGPKAVYAAIVEVTRALSLEGIGKGKENKQQGYKFRGIDDVYNALSMRLAEAKLCIIPRVTERTSVEHTSKSGGALFYVTCAVEFDLVSAVDGSMHTARMYGEAMDSADKATNKAMSAAYKYLAMEVFCIPTEGMPDADSETHEIAKPVVQPPKVAPAKKLGVEIVPDPKGDGGPSAKSQASPATSSGSPTSTTANGAARADGSTARNPSAPDLLKALMATMTEAGVFYGIEAKGKAREAIERERALRFLSRALKVEVKSRKDLTPAQIVTARGEAASWARLVTGLGKAAGLSTIAAFMETAIDRCGHHIDMPADMTEEEADALAMFLKSAKVPA